MFFNIIKDKSPSYLINYLPILQFSHNVNRKKNKYIFNRYRAVTDYFSNSLFPYCVNEWNKLSPEIRNSKCIYICVQKTIVKIHSSKRCTIYMILLD